MKKLLIFIITISLFSCDKRIDGIFYISNTSRDQPIVPLRLIVDNDTLFNQRAKYSNIAPDLQYIEQFKLEKGKHKIIFETTNTELKETKIIDFEKDKWIFLSYGYKAPADSLRINELNEEFKNIPNADSIYSDFYYGRKPSLIIHIMETEPIHH